MFSSPCSLRSTQCATLIALAAAAGLVRVETNTSAGSGPASEKAGAFDQSFLNKRTAQARNAAASFNSKTFDLSAVLFAQGRSSSTESFRLDAAASDFLRLISLLQVTVEMSDAADSAIIPVLTLASGQRPAYFNSPSPARSSRQHVFPFAVGPPHEDASSNPRADDTRVSGDLAVCGMWVVRVADCSKLPLIAHPTCDANRATKLAGLFSEPSFALRGEPDSLDRSVIGPLRARQRLHRDARINPYPV
jgi:hypothetical protein